MTDEDQIRKKIEKSLDSVSDRDGKTFNLFKYKGVLLPTMPILPEAISKLPLLSVHKSDILICAYPCCGTHWMWEVTSMLLKHNAERIPIQKEEYMLEFVSSQKFIDISPPRVFNTHLHPNFLPETVLSQNKIIFLVRNPKDVCVSYYNHNFGFLVEGYEGTFPSFFELLMEKRVPFGDYFDYLNIWWPVIKDNPNCLVISYEEASRNLLKVVNKIGEFLGHPPSAELAEGITELCSLNSMKKDKTYKICNLTQAELWKPGYSFYRKGKVGTWKEWLTVSQSERIDARVKSELADCDLPITYSI